jgi:ABC-type lipoprotein release transport system permease subunit
MNRALEIIYFLFTGFVNKTRLNKLSYKLVDLKNWLLNLPTSVPIVIRRTWRGRERAIAVIAGVFLATLVITTVFAYGSGLSKAALKDSVDDLLFDGKIDFRQDPGDNLLGRTNDSAVWQSVCDELTQKEEFEDCGLVFGRQGIRIDGFFDQGFVTPQPLNVESIEGAGNWANVSLDYPEALESGPPINDERIIRFYGGGIWDGELGERHSKDIMYGEWPQSGSEATEMRAVILPSKLASQAGVEVNDTIDSLIFSYVTDVKLFSEEMPGCDVKNIEYGPVDNGHKYCRLNMTVTNLTVAAIYQEKGAGNPTILFDPVIIPAELLSEVQKTTLMDYDHGYLGFALDRNKLPSQTADAAADYLDDLYEEVTEKRITVLYAANGTPPITRENLTTVSKIGVLSGSQSEKDCNDGKIKAQCFTSNVTNLKNFVNSKNETMDYFIMDSQYLGSRAEINGTLVDSWGGYADGEVELIYTDLIRGSIVFLNIFLGLVGIFNYILAIPIVVLSFSVLIYGLQLSLEQRRREIAIHRVIGGTQNGLRKMLTSEVIIVSTVAFIGGYFLSIGIVPDLLSAVGFMDFERNSDLAEYRWNNLGIVALIFTIGATIGVAWYYGRTKAKEFLDQEIEEGVKNNTTQNKPRFWLPLIAFLIGGFAALEIWIEDNGGLGAIGEDGLITNFITGGLLNIFAPFLLWIGGAIILGRIGAKGPEILVRIFGRTPLLSDIRRGLTNSTSSDTVNRLSVIMLLTLSIVTLAAIQGYTGTDVDERTASADIGADIQVQFVDPISREEAEIAVKDAINKVNDKEVKEIKSSTSVGTIYPTTKGSSGIVTTYVIFDNSENTLIWDQQSVPNRNIDGTMDKLSNDGFTAGEGAISLLDLPGGDDEGTNSEFEYKITLEYPEYSFRINPNYMFETYELNITNGSLTQNWTSNLTAGSLIVINNLDNTTYNLTVESIIGNITQPIAGGNNFTLLLEIPPFVEDVLNFNVTIDSDNTTQNRFEFGVQSSEPFPEIDYANSTLRETQIKYLGEHKWIPGISATDTNNAIILGENSYRKLVGDERADAYASTVWFFELCDQGNEDCKKALSKISGEMGNNEIVFSSKDWASSHEEVETNGGLIFGTQGLLSLQFMISSVAVVASAFVFLSLVLDQRSKELAILQAIGASPNQIRKLVLFEILSIIIVSMTLGVLLGIGVAQTFNGFFFVFGYIFQIFLGNAIPIDRELVWPWAEIIIVNISVLIAVIIALVLTTRKVLNANLAMILKGE